MLKIIIALSTLFLLIFATICSASEFNKGIYIGGSIGYGVTALSRPAQISSFTRDGFAWSVLAGYKIDKILSAEMGYFRMRNVDASGVIDGANVSDLIEPSFTYLALKGEFKIISKLRGYGKVGAAYSYGKENLQSDNQTIIPSVMRSRSKVVPYISGGIEYIMKKRLILLVDTSNTLRREGVPRLTTVSIGLLFNI